jgi:hypothetical protein
MRLTLIAATAGLLVLAAAPDASAQARYKVGVLTCTATDSPAGSIDASTRELQCHFVGESVDKYYRGSIQAFRRDIGSARQSRMAWAVLARAPNPWSRVLVGRYAPVGAALAGQVGAGALIGGGATELGGPTGSIILQPLGDGEGADIAAAVASLGLRTTRRPRH